LKKQDPSLTLRVTIGGDCFPSLGQDLSCARNDKSTGKRAPPPIRGNRAMALV
jgi:hypothetical protein